MPPVEPHSRAGARPAARRTDQRGRPQGDSAVQDARHDRHGGDDLPLQAGDGGVKAPVGEAYIGIENPKGELGNYLVSDGTAKPVRWRIRPPSFINLSALPKMAEGHLLSDLIAINASVDIVMGEVDR